MPLNVVKELKDFQPHMAVCSMTINDGSANKHNTPAVVQKAKSTKEVAILKMLKADSEEVLEKASVKNTESLLRAALKEKYQSAEEYRWVWLEDFDPEEGKAVFEMGDKTYAISYTVEGNGLITLSDDEQEVIQHSVYTTAEENDLILKGNLAVEEEEDSDVSEVLENEDSSPEPTSETIEEKQEEDVMSDKKDAPVEFTKAQQDQIAQLLKAEREAVIAEQEAATLLKSTKEALEAQEFVAKEDVEVFAKGLVANADLMAVVLKSLNSAKEALESKDAEIAEVKKEFATQEQQADESEVVISKGNVAETLAAQMAKLKG